MIEKKDNKTFCILPFVHLYAEPTGEMKPCCIAGGFEKPIDLKTMSIDEAFNSEQMKELREYMLEGKRHSVCDVCYVREDRGEESPRNQFNNNLTWELPEVSDDYTVTTDLQHVDIRFSNLCNFKCRMCNHTFSSNWHEEEEKVDHSSQASQQPKILKVSDTIVDDLKPYIKNVKSWYFAGGEPLIMPEHANLLNYLHSNIETIELFGVEKKGLSIHYNTNLSVLKFEKYNFLELWFDFYKVFLSISCDGIGKVGEYQRTGFNHEKFIKNLNLIRLYFEPGSTTTHTEGYNYNFQYTTTLYNVFHMEEFYDFMMNEGYITDERHIDWYYAWVPARSALKSLDTKDKVRVIDYLEKFKSRFKEDYTLNKLDSMISFVKEEEDPNWVKFNKYADVIKPNKIMDEMRGTSLVDLNGIDLSAEFESKRKKIGSDEWKFHLKNLDFS